MVSTSVTRRRCLAAISAGLTAWAKSDLATRWREIAGDTDGVVGAAILDLGSGRTVSLNGDDRFLLASVCKLPIAMNILAMVDEGKLRLGDQIEILPGDIVRQVSPLASRWPAQRRFPLDETLELMVARRDNTAVETLFRIGGGATSMAARFRQWRVEGVRIDRSEAQCALDSARIMDYPPKSKWDDRTFENLMGRATAKIRYRALERHLADPRDTGTPNGSVQLLSQLLRGEALSASSTSRLIEILRATTTGPRRLKGLLPQDAIVGHKTGTWGTVNGLNGATNDVGVISLRGRNLAIAVYVKASRRDEAALERIIARMARAAYDEWLTW